MSYDSSNLTTPDIKWLGVRPSDLDRFSIPQQCRLAMTDEDIRTGHKLVRRRSALQDCTGLCLVVRGHRGRGPWSRAVCAVWPGQHLVLARSGTV